MVNRFIRETAAYGRSDSLPKMAGDRDLHATISPLPRDQRAKQPKEPESAASATKPAPIKKEESLPIDEPHVPEETTDSEGQINS